MKRNLKKTGFIVLILLQGFTAKSMAQKWVTYDLKQFDRQTICESNKTIYNYGRGDNVKYKITLYGKSEQKIKNTFCANKPFVFETKLPESHYKIKITFGGAPFETSTTVKVESRRLMLENVVTKAGKFLTKTVVVDVRTPWINDSNSIRIKPREKNYLNWDDKLTLEFNGKNPCVSAISICKVDNIPVIYLAGNSTVTDQEYEPWASWGQMFPAFLKPNVVVANYAESGETLLAFKRENRLKKILNRMKKGDYLFMEFAHNDQKPGRNHLDAFTTYKDELKFYIAEARKKGGIPVLVTSTNRRKFDENGQIVNTLEGFPEAMRQVAKEENVALIDLNAMSKNFFEALGPEKSTKAFVHYPANSFPNQPEVLADNTHFNPYGAYELAKCVVHSIASQKLFLAKYVLKEWANFDPNIPDPVDEFVWYNSPAIDVLKPDGN
ncbi:MAG: rhamnogalacturonan acetylesterase [Paludibacter sp.]|nr:rhamnogalacturonan acetylesterase [Paludibacter sp.]